MKNNLNKEILINIVSKSLSIADVCRALNIIPAGGNYRTIKDKIKLWNICTKHFTGSGWNTGNKFKPFNKKIKLIDILVENSTYKSSAKLKARLFAEGIKVEKCEMCGIDSWLNKRINFDLHHINGNNTDNRIENLKILCPNCHAQTDNYKGKNINDGVRILRKKYHKRLNNKCECGKKINDESTHCVDCHHKKLRRVDRPTHEQLQIDINELGYCGTGRKYGVSDNAIRKWLTNKI